MLTTHEKIRLEAGFQKRYLRTSFLNSPDSSNTVFYVPSRDVARIVPDYSTGNTIAGVSDVQVWVGLSGVAGSSRMVVSSVDSDTGAVTVNSAPTTGVSLTVSFASSPLTSVDVENVRLQAESIINQRLSLCYDLPISPVPAMLTSLASRLGGALLLIRDYGTGARSTSKDGYALYDKLMGNKQVSYSDTGIGVIEVGEIGMLCTPGYQIVDDNGNIIPRNDDANLDSNTTYTDGGRINGRLYDVTEENIRFKDFQSNVNADQPGTVGYNYPRRTQG